MNRRIKKQGLIFIVSGPSGSGKTTLLKSLLRREDLKNKLARSISFTTRPQRSGEKDKKDYFFIGAEQFQREKRAHRILEWTKYLGCYYATPRGFVEKQVNKGRHVIACLDLRGAQEIKKHYPQNTVTIFIMPPSLGVLLNRITGRCRKTKKEEVKQRLKLAQEELLASSRYDYCLVNNDLGQAIRQAKDIIVKEIGCLN